LALISRYTFGQQNNQSRGKQRAELAEEEKNRERKTGGIRAWWCSGRVA
jgi:hypothetical protein